MLYLYLAPWDWVIEGDMSSWRMPRADIGLGALDLRSLPQCGSPGPIPQGFGLFTLSQRDDTIGYYLGDSLGSLVRAPLKRAVQTALSLGEDIVADTPLTILVELLNRYADPTGQMRWKPLRGSLRRGTRLSLAGQEVWAQALDPVMRANTIAVFQADYRRNKAAGMALANLRKWTGSAMSKLWGQMSDELAAQLLPSEYVADGWQIPSTTITESFNTADSDILGPDLAWTETFNDIDIVSNQAANGDSGTPNVFERARADSDLASDDHYAQGTLTFSGAVNNRAGVAVRFAPTADTCYTVETMPLANFAHIVSKVVTGTRTQLDTNTDAGAPTSGQVGKLQIDGSQIDYTWNGVAQNSFTDPIITGNLRCGISLQATHATIKSAVDTWEAGDLAAAGIALERIERHYPRGIMRGVLRGVE